MNLLIIISEIKITKSGLKIHESINNRFNYRLFVNVFRI